jgi:hypothetical protein
MTDSGEMPFDDDAPLGDDFTLEDDGLLEDPAPLLDDDGEAPALDEAGIPAAGELWADDDLDAWLDEPPDALFAGGQAEDAFLPDPELGDELGRAADEGLSSVDRGDLVDRALRRTLGGEG